MSKLTESILRERTKFRNLQEIRKIDLWGYQLSDITLISNLKNIEIASLSNNKINSLQPFKNCTQLHALFLRNNQISDFEELNFLSELPNLHILWLSNNPIALDANYREKVMQILPKLRKLDEDEITDFERMETLKSSKSNLSGRKYIQPTTPSFSEIPIDDNLDNINSSPKKSVSKSKSQPVSSPTDAPTTSPRNNPRQKKTSVQIPDTSLSPPQIPTKTSNRAHRKNDKPLLNSILMLLPELSQDSLDIILQQARKLRDE